MWLKNKKIKILNNTIEKLTSTLEKGNYIEWSYILRKQKRNNKKEPTSRNIQRSRNRSRSNNNNSNTNNNLTKNRNTKHPRHRRIHRRHRRDC